MPTTNVDINFRAELKELRKSLATMPGIADKEAKSMVTKLTRNFKAAERASKKNADQIADNSKKMAGVLEGAKQAAEGFGGALGSSAGQVEKFGRAGLELGGALGPIPLILGAAGLASVAWGVALVKTGQAVVGLIRSSDELISKVEKFDAVLGPIDPATIESIHRTTDAFDALDVIADRIRISLSGGLAGGLEETAVTMVKLGLILEDTSIPTDKLATGFRALLGTVSPTALAALEGAFAGVKVAVHETGKATSNYDAEARALIGSIRAQKEEEDQAADKARLLAAAQREAAEAERERATALREIAQELKAQQDASVALADIIEDAGSDQLNQFELRRRAYEDEVRKIRQLGEVSEDVAATRAALDAADRRRVRDMTQLRIDEIDRQSQVEVEADMTRSERVKAQLQSYADEASAVLSHISQISGQLGNTISTFANLRIDALREEAEAEVANREDRIAAWQEDQETQLNHLYDIGRISDDEFDSRLAQIESESEARKVNAQKLKKDEEKAARRGFRLSQSVAVIQATIDSARNAVALTPAFIGIAGPGAPAAAALAAGAGLAAQLAVINSQSPPEFALGGMVSDRAYSGDHLPIAASPFEGILSPRGVAAAGGPQGLDSLNRGMPASVHVDFHMDRRIVASSVASAVANDPMVGARLDARSGAVTGQTATYGRG